MSTAVSVDHAGSGVRVASDVATLAVATFAGTQLAVWRHVADPLARKLGVAGLGLAGAAVLARLAITGAPPGLPLPNAGTNMARGTAVGAGLAAVASLGASRGSAPHRLAGAAAAAAVGAALGAGAGYVADSIPAGEDRRRALALTFMRMAAAMAVGYAWGGGAPHQRDLRRISVQIATLGTAAGGLATLGSWSALRGSATG